MSAFEDGLRASYAQGQAMRERQLAQSGPAGLAGFFGGAAGLGQAGRSGIGFSVGPSHLSDRKPKPVGIKAELQADVDEWLADVTI